MRKNKLIIISTFLIISVSIVGIIPLLQMFFLLEPDEKPNEKIDYSRNFAILKGHGWRVREVAFSKDDTLLATGASDGSIKIWNISSGRSIYSLQRHLYGVIALDFSPSGEILASGGIDNKVNLWNISTGNLIKTIQFNPHGILDLKWLPDGELLAVGGGEWMSDVHHTNDLTKILQLINITSGKSVKSFIGHKDTITSLSFSKNGSFLISGSWDNTVKLWNVETGEEIKSFNHTKYVMDVEFSIDEKSIISGSMDKTINIWEIDSGTIKKELLINQSIWSISLSSIDSTLAVACGDSMDNLPNDHWRFYGKKNDTILQLWNITAGEILKSFNAHNNTIESVKFSHDGSILASASWDWTIKLWGNNLFIKNEDMIDNWQMSTLEDQGINSTKLYDSLGYLDSTRIHSLLIAKNNKLVYEKYYQGYSQDYNRYLKHTHFSATKSFTSSLIGIAIDKGFIQSISQKISDFFPDKMEIFTDSKKENITIHHLLTMTMGLDWYDIYDIWNMAVAIDSVDYILSKKMVNDPGTHFDYNTGASQLLSAIIQRSTGMSTIQFAIQYLFQPLGIEESDVIWMSHSDGVNFGGIGLFITPRNMAIFGQLYLNKGMWNDNQIISESWILTSQIDHIEGIPRIGLVNPIGYGYQYWMNFEGYTALGYGGQTIQVYPKDNLVIVTTADEIEETTRFIYQHVKNSFLV
ncbi:MAG: serine hydrolase [Candidatus Hodarchaeales archaeon]